MAPPFLRCAIYTRKSSEEGLEQGFNSLHAQREACEAYVLSQAGEGWRVLDRIYDDGGFSGGSMDRPGLAELLRDIEQKLIDIVVVYKVDRLTRSLSDFARIVEVFDRQGVSFVSVTQAFNTTSSMGRLTLNVLLSFAQFEREVTGERIRDKISASKAKGMWMGGGVPLGYDIPSDAAERVLQINEADAETVRFIFHRYLELGAVSSLVDDLRERGFTTRRRVNSKGEVRGGCLWSIGNLHYLLRNRVYRGDIVHKGVVHPGLHQPIIDPSTFDTVQRMLAKNRRRGLGRAAAPLSPLAGKIFDDAGNVMSPTSVRKAGRVYRYYVSATELRRGTGQSGSVRRISAIAVERLVAAELEARVDLRRCENDAWSALERVRVEEGGFELTLRKSALKVQALGDDMSDGWLDVRVTRRGYHAAAGREDAVNGAVMPDPDIPMQKAIARARRWADQLASGERRGADHIAEVEGLQSRYVDKVLGLAFLSPGLTVAVMRGERLALPLSDIIERDLPLCFEEQETLLCPNLTRRRNW